MKKLLLVLALVGLLTLCFGGTARGLSTPLTVTPPPTLSAIDPATARNDIDTVVTITGAGFATD